MISAFSDQAEIIIKCHVGRQSDTNSRTLPKTFLSEKSDLSDFPKMQRISNDVKQLTVKLTSYMIRYSWHLREIREI